MYRLVVYELVFLLGVAGVLGYLHVLPYDPLFLLYSTFFIFCITWLSNQLFSFFFDAPSNPESVWITALILALIITPAHSWFDARFIPLAFWAASWAIASKYIFAIGKKHVFNPAAIGVAIPSLVLGVSASWWVGTPVLVPFVLLGGVLVVRKIRRFDLWWSFIGVFFVGILLMALTGTGDVLKIFNRSFFYAPTFFFATVMLTEPATAPTTKFFRILYGMFVGFLFLPNVHFGSFYPTPEIALLLGNIFAYTVSSKQKLLLHLKEIVQLSADTYEFIFKTDTPFAYAPGQYMEWTLPHAHADSRSVRRYFTLSSSPTERDVRLGVKFYPHASTFKQALLAMRTGDSILASQLAGDFVLPTETKKKLVFIAGGIGSTPFRSMIKYLIDTRQTRDIVLFYSNKTPADAVYSELFETAGSEIGLRRIYACTDPSVPLFEGAIRRIDSRAILEHVPDYEERIFFISGPQGMVTAFRNTLLKMGVRKSHIKTDYFPGFA